MGNEDGEEGEGLTFPKANNAPSKNNATPVHHTMIEPQRSASLLFNCHRVHISDGYAAEGGHDGKVMRTDHHEEHPKCDEGDTDFCSVGSKYRIADDIGRTIIRRQICAHIVAGK